MKVNRKKAQHMLVGDFKADPSLQWMKVPGTAWANDFDSSVMSS